MAPPPAQSRPTLRFVMRLVMAAFFVAGFVLHMRAPDALVSEVEKANTARHVLELCAAQGFTDITTRVCQRVVEHLSRHAGPGPRVRAYLVDFNGTLLGQHPAPPRQEEAA